MAIHSIIIIMAVINGDKRSGAAALSLKKGSGDRSNHSYIQTSNRDWNHPVFRAGSLLPEVIISSKLSP